VKGRLAAPSATTDIRTDLLSIMSSFLVGRFRDLQNLVIGPRWLARAQT
jgi:hypothetical protein